MPLDWVDKLRGNTQSGVLTWRKGPKDETFTGRVFGSHGQAFPGRSLDLTLSKIGTETQLEIVMWHEGKASKTRILNTANLPPAQKSILHAFYATVLAATQINEEPTDAELAEVLSELP